MSDHDARLTSGARLEEDGNDAALRPQTLADFTGQPALRENLSVFVQAARDGVTRIEVGADVWEITHYDNQAQPVWDMLQAAHAAMGLTQVPVKAGPPNLVAVLQTPRGTVTLESKGT